MIFPQSWCMSGKKKQTNFILWGNTGAQTAIELIDKGAPEARNSTWLH